MYYFSLTSRRLAPSICGDMIYGGFLSFIYWNILLSSFINSILCSKSSRTVWLQKKLAVSPYVMYFGAINWTLMWSASVVPGNHAISVSMCILSYNSDNWHEKLLEQNIITRLHWQESWNVTVSWFIFLLVTIRISIKRPKV